MDAVREVAIDRALSPCTSYPLWSTIVRVAAAGSDAFAGLGVTWVLLLAWLLVLDSTSEWLLDWD